MALKYRLGPARRAFNAVASRAIRHGIGLPSSYILTTRGRKTGIERSTPVSIVRRDGHRWLVAPYGSVGWVHNARAAGRVTLSKGGRSDVVAVTEVGPHEAAPILRAYLRTFPVVRPFFNFGARSIEEKIVEEAPRHPVFRIDD
ncbi:MAG: nitroreductase family deazaflavin-dependent oxidoreductase [Actinomycetota bacterium]